MDDQSPDVPTRAGITPEQQALIDAPVESLTIYQRRCRAFILAAIEKEKAQAESNAKVTAMIRRPTQTNPRMGPIVNDPPRPSPTDEKGGWLWGRSTPGE